MMAQGTDTPTKKMNGNRRHSTHSNPEGERWKPGHFLNQGD
jgi:hypothetical protein